MATLTLSIFAAATLLALGTWLAPRFADRRENANSTKPTATGHADYEVASASNDSPADIQNIRGLSVWWRELNSVRVLTLFGRITRSTSEYLRDVLKTEATADAAKPLVVDLTAVRRIEQPGWTAILWGRDLLASRDRTLRVLMAVGSQPYRSYFRCGVDAALPRMRILNETAAPAARASSITADAPSREAQALDEVAPEPGSPVSVRHGVGV